MKPLVIGIILLLKTIFNLTRNDYDSFKGHFIFLDPNKYSPA